MGYVKRSYERKQPENLRQRREEGKIHRITIDFNKNVSPVRQDVSDSILFRRDLGRGEHVAAG